MKTKGFILLWLVFLLTGCAAQRSGCPGSTFYNKGNAKQNARAAKQMKLF